MDQPATTGTRELSIQLTATLEGHDDRVWAVCWAPGGGMLASCSGDRTVRVWKETRDGSWACVETLSKAHNRTVRGVAWSACGKFLVSTGFDAVVAVYEVGVEGFEQVATLDGHENEVKSAAWDSSSCLLATCSRDKSVWVWETVDSRYGAYYDDNDGDEGMRAGTDDGGLTDFECVAVLQGHTQDVKHVAWHPNDPLLASVSYDDSVKLWREEDDDWYCCATLNGHQSTVWDLSFSPDGTRIATVGADARLIIWKRKDSARGVVGGATGPSRVASAESGPWSLECCLQGHAKRPIYSVDWCKATDGGEVMIASCGGDDSIFIYTAAKDAAEKGMMIDDEEDMGKGGFQLGCRLDNAHSRDVNCVAWNPKRGDILASCGDDGVVKLWRVSRAVE